ncbi:MAG: hypothetical protein WAN36_05000 [Calditrichia bacterium]
MKIPFFIAGVLLALTSSLQSQNMEISYPMEIPVVVVKYFPVQGELIDIKKTGDVDMPLSAARQKTDSLTGGLVRFLEDASRYHAYKNPQAEPSLDYRILNTYEFLEPLPTREKHAGKAPMTDYQAIFNRINGTDWVENQGVKEIWLWGYHGGKVGLWESNMGGPFGDVSNSNRDEEDLPVLDNTYTFYHYNYQRGLSEAIEDHMHQIEALLNHVDGRDTTKADEWDQLLFWGKFVGSNKSHKIIEPHAGWAHYPPNAEKDYDWANKAYVLTDMEDWHPDGTGEKKRVNCERWDCSSMGWFKLWMQSLPGKNNNLQYQGKPLTNWWIFVGDWDLARQKNLTLVHRTK